MNVLNATPTIEIRGLAKSYGDLDVLRGVDITVGPGEIFGYLGLNGSGKSTTVRAMLGLMPYDAGDVRLMGRSIPAHISDVRAVVGCLFGEPGLYQKLTLSQNLEFFGGAYGLSKKESISRSMPMLEALGLENMIDRRVSTLSTGECRKGGLVRALLHAPQILVLDEPTANLDTVSILAIRQFIKNLASTGVTVFMTTHQLDDVQAVCGRAAILSNGAIAMAGTPAQIAATSASPTVQVELAHLPNDLCEKIEVLDHVIAVEKNGYVLTVRYDQSPDVSLLNRVLAANDAEVLSLNLDRGDIWRSFMSAVGGAC